MYLLFDIGASKMRLAVSKDCKSFEQSTIIGTPSGFAEGMKMIGEFVGGLGEKLEGASGGTPGPFNLERTEIATAPNMPDWNGKPLMQELRSIVKAPIFLENDAALAGVGEARYGSGKGYPIVAYLTVSTGVGGARIVDGKIDRNTFGFEPGAQIIGSGKYFFCPHCGKNEILHLEGYGGGRALKERFGKDAELIDEPEIWEEAARSLAFGLNNITVMWSPGVIVLGGSIMRKRGEILLPRIISHLQNLPQIFPKLPELKITKLGEESGLWGALAHLRDNLGIT